MVTLKNDFIKVEILPLGVTFKSFSLLRDGVNIITAYENLDQYQRNDVYLGSCVGPLAGRTEQGMYGLDLDTNADGFHLHGGSKGISSQVFDVKEVDDGAIFTLNSDQIAYTITVSLEGHSLTIDFLAVPEFERPINMTNHMYFNLDGSDTVDHHTIQVKASRVSLHNKDMYNEGNLIPVEGTVFDLRKEKRLSQVLKETHPQFEMTRHIDHSFLGQELILKTKDKSLSVKGTMPAMHVYLANFFDESFKDEKGRLAKNHASIAIEAQYMPNDPHMPLYSKEKPYKESITYIVE